MISDRLGFRGLDADRVANLVDLGRPAGASDTFWWAPPGLCVLREADRVIKAFHTRRGRLPVDEVEAATGPAEALARAYSARWVVVAETAALEAAAERAAERLRPGCDLVDFGLECAQAASEELASGRIEIWPRLTDGMRIPSRKTLERAFDVVLPPRSSAVLYVFDARGLHAEAICVRGDHDVEILAGHDALDAGPPPRDWRARYGEILAAVEGRFAKPSVGVFASREAVRLLSAGPISPSDLSALLARKELILDPLPAWLAAPLGVAAVRGAVEAGRDASARLVRTVDFTGIGRGIAGRVGGAVRKRIRGSAVAGRVERTLERVGSKADLSELLGFDPFVLAARLLELWAASEGRAEP